MVQPHIISLYSLDPYSWEEFILLTQHEEERYHAVMLEEYMAARDEAHQMFTQPDATDLQIDDLPF